MSDADDVAGLESALADRARKLSEEHLVNGRQARDLILLETRQRLRLEEERETLAAKARGRANLSATRAGGGTRSARPTRPRPLAADQRRAHEAARAPVRSGGGRGEVPTLAGKVLARGRTGDRARRTRRPRQRARPATSAERLGAARRGGGAEQTPDPVAGGPELRRRRDDRQRRREYSFRQHFRRTHGKIGSVVATLASPNG